MREKENYCKSSIKTKMDVNFVSYNCHIAINSFKKKKNLRNFKRMAEI